MTIWIVNPFDNLPTEGCRPQRYWLMAQAFVRAGHTVTYFTSDFSHATKAKRKSARAMPDVFAVIALPTRPYHANISLRRILSHRQLANDFLRAAHARRAEEKPQLIIASMPPLGLCRAALDIAHACGVPFIADIQDAWPETFARVVPTSLLRCLGLYRAAARIYTQADAVSAVAARYLALARAYGSTAPTHLAGHAIAHAHLPPARHNHTPLRLVYAGNMSLSYDLETIINALRDRTDMTLDLAGNGPDRARLERLVGTATNIRFLGYLGETKLAERLAESDIGIIPMFPDSAVGVPGKLADYAAAGLHVVECLGGETEALIAAHHVGTHYTPGKGDDFMRAIEHARTMPFDDTCARHFANAFDATRIMDDYAAWAVSSIGVAKRIEKRLR